MLSTALTTALRSSRADYNSRFMEARRLHPGLDSDSFSEFLSAAVDNLVKAVAERNPEVVPRVVSVAYDVALELVGQHLVGTSARLPWQERLWQHLPQFASWVAASPDLVIPNLCNALHNISITADSRPQQWLDDLERLSPLCRTVEEFLRCGQIAAWRAGLAQLRKGALALGRTLPELLSLAAVDAQEGLSCSDVFEKLSVDPWYDPGERGTRMTTGM